MGLQKTVNNSPAIGLGGQPVVLGQSVYTTMNFMSDGNVKAGAFAFAPSAATTFPDNIKTEYVTNKGTAVIGFVERNFVGTGASSEVYAKGVVLNIAIRGDYYLVAPAGTTPTKGYKVITTDATGAISFAASASTGETDTGWVVTEGGSAGDTIVISNHG